MNMIEIIKARLPNGRKAQAELFAKQYAASPRGQYDNLGTILIAPSKTSWVATHDVAVDTSMPLGNSPEEHWENLRKEQLKIKKSDIAVAYPISTFKLAGGEVSLALGAKLGCWDRDVVGFIYATKEQVRTWYGTKRITQKHIEHAKTCLQAELDLLTAWLNGECYGWQVKEYMLTDDGLDWEAVDVLESCWGYFDQAQARNDMQDMLNQLTQNP